MNLDDSSIPINVGAAGGAISFQYSFLSFPPALRLRPPLKNSKITDLLYIKE